MPAKALKVKMQLRIARIPRKIFDAVVDPARMSKYFTSHGSGRLDSGNPVRWEFADVGMKLIIKPNEFSQPCLFRLVGERGRDDRCHVVKAQRQDLYCSVANGIGMACECERNRSLSGPDARLDAYAQLYEGLPGAWH
jgi:hypothetical protein